MKLKEHTLYHSDSKMQQILDDALQCAKDLGWKFLRLPDSLHLWTPDNTGEYSTVEFKVYQCTGYEYTIHQWNNLGSHLRGAYRDIKGTERDKVFGFISNVTEYSIRLVQYEQVTELLKKKRIKYYYNHRQGFELRYRQFGVEHYLRFALKYNTNVNAILEVIDTIPNGKPSSTPDMFSSLSRKEWSK